MDYDKWHKESHIMFYELKKRNDGENRREEKENKSKREQVQETYIPLILQLLQLSQLPGSTGNSDKRPTKLDTVSIRKQKSLTSSPGNLNPERKVKCHITHQKRKRVSEE